jgi:cobalt-zinc-cadmium efflux system outer membrane protein
MRFAGMVALCVFALAPTEAGAQARALGFADVLARAREQAPQVISGRLALEEVRARLRGASLRFQQNPELEAALGRRNADTNRFTDIELRVSQPFEPGSRRAARVASVNAAIEVGSADVDETIRLVVRAAAVAYYQGLHAAERERLWSAAVQFATGIEEAASRRFRAGDIAILDVNLARAARARARSEQESAGAAKAIAIGELQQLLQIADSVELVGTLETSNDSDLPTLIQSALQRPELRGFEAAIREAEAEVQLGNTFSKPDYGLGGGYQREGGDRVVFGAITISFPMFAKGQEQRAVGSARAARLRAERDAARARVRVEVASRFRAYEQSLRSLQVLLTDALPSLDENETLSTRSFEVGQIGLPDLLLIRREILDTRFQYLDVLLEVALARIELHASASVLR